jgi:hypothetical protein
MVEGHTIRALLDPAIKSTFAFQLHEIPHNLTGPAFLFASGIAFAVSTARRWESYHRWSDRLRRRALHWLLVLLIGYTLQLPFLSVLRTLRQANPAQLQFLASMNILQCIVLSLALLQILILAVPNWPAFLPGALSLTAVIALATPFLWKLSPDLPLWIGTAVGPYWGSYFPLFPYAGFISAGAVWGHRFLQAEQSGREATFLRRSLWLGGGLCVVGGLYASLTFPPTDLSFWDTSPLLFGARVGILMVFAVSLRFVEPYWQTSLRILLTLGRESLPVYVIHLLVLFGSVWNPNTNLVKLAGTSLGVAEASLIFLLFTAVLLLLAWWWRWWKEHDGWRVQAVRWLLASYFILSLLTGYG